MARRTIPQRSSPDLPTLESTTRVVRTQAWRVDADGALSRGAMLPPMLGIVRPGGAGHVLALDDAGDALLVNAATEQGRRISLDDGSAYPVDADARAGMLGLLVTNEAGGMEVRLYRVR